MSVKGLVQSERQAQALDKRLKVLLAQQQRELKDEIDKIEFLLSDKQQLLTWRNSPAESSRIQKILQDINETEALYLQAGETRAAEIFKTRMTKQLKTKLTNLKINELEVTIKAEKYRAATKQTLLKGMNNIRTEGQLTEMYNQARQAGGFLSNFGRAYMKDLITLETKTAGSKTLGEYMENLYRTYEKELKNVYVRGIIRGDSYRKMVDNLRRGTNITAGKANLLITTEANAIFNESVREVIDDNPLVKGYRFRAVLDSRTSKLCQQHDGKYIPKEDVKPGINYPPLHPRCRSTVTTVLANEDERKDTTQRYTKNTSNQWEKVPPGMTYQEFKDKFGFTNSMNPKSYNPATRSIHDKTLARITPNHYKGYVKPSISSVGRIDKMVEAYMSNDNNYLDVVKQNTGHTDIKKALFRQAQAESGFDGLPLQLDALSFEEQVSKNNYRTVYRQFKREEDFTAFKTGDQPFGRSTANYGAGTYVFSDEPNNEDYGKTTVMALKTPESKVLRFSDLTDSQISIGQARTPDMRINRVLEQVPEAQRRDLLSILAIKYGYDAMEVKSQLRGNYLVILNRTAVIVKGG